MLSQLLKEVQVEIDPDQLDEPFSYHHDGTMASLGELIDQEAPQEVREALGRADQPDNAASPIKQISSLSDHELRRLAINVLERTNKDEHLAFVSDGSFSPDQLMQEVKIGTVVGLRFVASLRRHGLFLEAAVRDGRVKRSDGDQTFPDFEF